MFLALLFVTTLLQAQAQEWSSRAAIPPEGRENILQLPSNEWAAEIQSGKLHAQIYPVTVTGMLPAYRPVKQLLEEDSANPFRQSLEKLIHGLSGIKNFNDLMVHLGLNEYPQVNDVGVYSVPFPQGQRPNYRLGFGTIEREGALGFTFSCAACHSANLFGKTVLGLTNRFPRSNDFFIHGKKAAQVYNPWVFAAYTGATAEEAKITNESVANLSRVAMKEPLIEGLDTSLAQVSLSLNRRALDPWASVSKWSETFPRKDPFLDEFPADSKPAVWWNLKYKNRWLSDGSVISGNPIFTNIIWNEIGRGADLKTLSSWLLQNKKVIDELTSAVFAMQAPRITDFFPAENINLEAAKHGEKLFNQKCSHCHGVYEKTWSLPGADQLKLADQLQTTKVIPKRFTPVEDVGTDPYRRLGMKSLEKLNDLEISKTNNVEIKHQNGYVPPPLVGIWARWPYMHNNSMPTLCEVLTPASERVTSYFAGEAQDPATDFDFECNGYPLGGATPKLWKTKARYYQNSRAGMSNSGHDEGVFLENGINQLSRQDRRDLIQYLQTL